MSIVHHHVRVFSPGRNPRGCQSMILNTFFSCAALLKPLIGQLGLLTCLSLCISPVENRRFNECRVRCSTRGTTTSQTMRHLSYHLSSLHFWHHHVGWNCQGDQEDELSMEDLHETTARIHALLDAEAALVTWMQDNAFG